MAQATQLEPQRFAVGDAAGIRKSLRQNGYAVVSNAATPPELRQARSLLWEHLEQQHGWLRGQPKTWTDAAYEEPRQGGHGLGGNPVSGLLASTVHSDCFWHCRTLPGVLSAFAAAYGTDDLVTAYDNMAVNRPITCEQPSMTTMGTGRGEKVAHRWDASLHTHLNQDGFGDDVFIVYAILPLWDMNEKTGTTAICPGSHTPDNVESITKYRSDNQQLLASDVDDVNRHLRPFWNLGLRPGPVSCRAGELCIFDTAMFHSACPATEPGSSGNELLRAICIMSMVPRLLLSPAILKARQLAYETAQGTGGSVLGRSGRAEEILISYNDDPTGFLAKRPPRPKCRDFATSSLVIRKIVGENFDFTGAPPQSRVYRSTEVRMQNQKHLEMDSRLAAVAKEFQERAVSGWGDPQYRLARL